MQVKSSTKKLKDYSGLKKNKLTAIRFSRRFNNKTYWIFLCDCGQEKELRLDNVFSKYERSKNCGCEMIKIYYEMSCNKIVKVYQPSLEKNIDYYSKLYFKLYVKSAKKRDINFNLTIEQFSQIILKDCTYCGIAPYKSIEKSPYLFNGIDRVDNLKGYELSNCKPCCEICNKAKRNLSINAFKEWINRIVINNK